MNIIPGEIEVAQLTVENTVGDRSPGRLLRRINRLLEKRIESRFSDSDLSFEEWMAIKLIHDGIVTNAGDLSKDFAISSGATTRLIDGLEKSGLVERDRTNADRRMVLLKLTSAGLERYHAKIPVMLKSWNELLADFDATELSSLVALLTKLHDAFERDEATRL
jgi:DNA-binding MarR family transcriptional regulator